MEQERWDVAGDIILHLRIKIIFLCLKINVQFFMPTPNNEAQNKSVSFHVSFPRSCGKEIVLDTWSKLPLVSWIWHTFPWLSASQTDTSASLPERRHHGCFRRNDLNSHQAEFVTWFHRGENDSSKEGYKSFNWSLNGIGKLILSEY